MSDSEALTKLTIETILERIAALSTQMASGFGTVEQRLEQIEIRLDRVESMALDSRADVRELRLDFKKFREQLKLPA